MNRRILALLSVVAVAAIAAIPAAGQSHVATGPKVFKSYKCNARVSQYQPASWACTTVTVNPLQVDSGATTSVTFAFKAKTALKYINLCFSKVDAAGKNVSCLYKHKYRKIKRGTVVKRVFQVIAPTVSSSGGYKFDNYTGFYKHHKWALPKEAYWMANSYMCIISPSQPDFQCSG